MNPSPQTLTCLLALSLGYGLLAQTTIPPRSTPGANSGADSRSTGVTNAEESKKLKLGDYVELDESIRNEMYGTIDFPNAELKDIVRAISKLASKNFILDNKLNNRKITIISPEAVTKGEAYNAFLSALYMNDLTIVSMGKFLKVIETKSAIQSNIRVFVGEYAPANEEVVTLLYPLKFLNADETQRYLVDLVPRAGRITAYPNTNTLVMTDTGLNLRRIISVLKSIDIAGHEDQLENIPIRYASAKQISGLIDDILEAQNGGNRSRPGAGPSRGPQKTRGGGIITKIVPDERTNSLVVLANGRGVQELKGLVAKLDSPNAAGNGNIHIYYCKNAVSEELAATINSLISGQTKAPTTGGNTNPVPGQTPVVNFPAQARRASSDDGVKLEGNIRVTADKPTNSLVVVGSSADFAALKSVLRRLDIPRRQVYVEATIMEMNANDQFQFGPALVNVASPNSPSAAGFFPASGASADKILAGTGAATLPGVVAGIGLGKAYKFTFPGAAAPVTINTVTGLIQALQQNNQGHILHQPQILTSDNQDSEIRITERIPTINQTVNTATNPPSTANTIEKNDIELSLKVTPQIGEGSDLIKLKIDQTIDDFENATVGGLQQISITKRKANTTVTVRSGDSVVIGGLQKTIIKDARSKFPLLGDLPVLGWFFKYQDNQTRRSDLLLFMTPHVISQYSDLLKITQRRLEDREKLGKKVYDPKDPMKTELKILQSKNAADMEKAPPRTWGFKPKLDVDDEPKTEKEDEPSSSDNLSPSADNDDPNGRILTIETPSALKAEQSNGDTGGGAR